jgi:hypothetical protein
MFRDDSQTKEQKKRRMALSKRPKTLLIAVDGVKLG